MARWTSDRLARLLDGYREVDEWSVVESEARRVAGRVGPKLAERQVRRATALRQLGAVLYCDSERGRGTARLWVAAETTSTAELRALVDAAIERAAQAVGPPWSMPPPAAPARVEVADPDILADPDRALERIVGAVARSRSTVERAVGGEVAVEARTHRVESSRGFSSEFGATRASYDLLVGGRAVKAGAGPSTRAPESARGQVRTMAQLRLPRAMTDAAKTAADRARAAPIEAGRYDLLLRPAALVGPPGPGLAAAAHEPWAPSDFGWFAPLVAAADGRSARLGLGRYQVGQSIFGSDPSGDRFTLASDGTLDHAPRSAPFGFLGEPVRRFELVRNGIAAGLALDTVEAALAGTTPNGGPRNLILDTGARAIDELAELGPRPLIEIEQLAWLDVDPLMGAATFEIALGRVRRAGIRRNPAFVAGGLVVGNVFDMLGRARLARDAVVLDWYRGPTAVRIDDVEVV